MPSSFFFVVVEPLNRRLLIFCSFFSQEEGRKVQYENIVGILEWVLKDMPSEMKESENCGKYFS